MGQEGGVATETGTLVLVTPVFTAGYVGEPVVADMSLEFPAGRMTAILGRNGAGKTTLLPALSGTLRYSRGSVTLGGVNITAWSPKRRVSDGIANAHRLISVADEMTVLHLGRVLASGSPHVTLRDPEVSLACMGPALVQLDTSSPTPLEGCHTETSSWSLPTAK